MRKCIFVFLLISFSCASPSKEQNNELISPKAAADRLKSNPAIVVIDVRTPEEMQSGFIQGAINLNYNSPAFEKSLGNLDQSKTYLLYCASGKRSGNAHKMMREKGFDNILSIEGGLDAWEAARLPVVRR